jgi:hypothetical protein
MEYKEMVKVTKIRYILIAWLACIVTLVAIAGTPVLKTLSNASYTLGTNAKDTITLTSFQMTGDSAGIMSEINQDSCSATFSYEYSSPNGYTGETAFASLDTIMTQAINKNGAFSGPLGWKAGAYKANIYIVLMNNKATSQTINMKIYSINWR